MVPTKQLFGSGSRNTLHTTACLAHHPKEARSVLGHVQLWIHVLQEPPEVPAAELGPELPPLCHVPVGLLGRQDRESCRAQCSPRRPVSSLTLASTGGCPVPSTAHGGHKQPQGRHTALPGAQQDCIPSLSHYQVYKGRSQQLLSSQGAKPWSHTITGSL